MLFQEDQQIGNYSLIKFLGEGGFGEVWLAEKHNNPSEKVAIKLPRKEDIDLQTVKEEIFNWTLAGKHKNILPLLECETFGNQVAIVSEFAPDGSLQKLLELHRSFSVADAVEIIIGILDGLEHLHNRKIIHRDLKPDNVLFQGRTPRLTDFGISRAMTVSSQSQTVSGTLFYMAPETFDGKRNAQTDIWSVGVIFYQLLAGVLPFPQKEKIELIGAIVQREPMPLPASIPNEFQAIVAKSLKKDTAQRFQTAEEMKASLKEALNKWKKTHNQLVIDKPNPVRLVEKIAAIEPVNETIIDEDFEKIEHYKIEPIQNSQEIEIETKLSPQKSIGMEFDNIPSPQPGLESGLPNEVNKPLNQSVTQLTNNENKSNPSFPNVKEDDSSSKRFLYKIIFSIGVSSLWTILGLINMFTINRFGSDLDYFFGIVISYSAAIGLTGWLLFKLFEEDRADPLFGYENITLLGFLISRPFCLFGIYLFFFFALFVCFFYIPFAVYVQKYEGRSPTEAQNAFSLLILGNKNQLGILITVIGSILGAINGWLSGRGLYVQTIKSEQSRQSKPVQQPLPQKKLRPFIYNLTKVATGIDEVTMRISGVDFIGSMRLFVDSDEITNFQVIDNKTIEFIVPARKVGDRSFLRLEINGRSLHALFLY